MSAEQDRAAAEQWAEERIAENCMGWERPNWRAIHLEDAFLAGIAFARGQTTEMIDAVMEAKKIIAADGQTKLRWFSTCTACQVRKILVAALAKVTK